MNKKELRKISLQFRTLSSQMLKIDSEEEKTRIKAFFDFITETDFIHDYIIKCHQEEYDFDDVFSHLQYRQQIILPSDDKELIDLEYQLLQYVVEGNKSLFVFGRNYTSSNKYADMISAFMRKVIEPFVIALRSYLELNLIDAVDEEEIIETSKSTSVFLSYCQKDSDIADLIDNGLKNRLKDAISISRDIRDVEYHGSFKQFMQSIQEHDYVIIIISDHYLKSRNCMFEMLETIKDAKYQSRLLFIVLHDDDERYFSEPQTDAFAADVYSNDGQVGYSLYWKQKEIDLQEQADQLGDPVLAINQLKEIKIVRKILLDLPDFLEFVRDNNAISLTKHLEENFTSMCKFMNIEA